MEMLTTVLTWVGRDWHDGLILKMAPAGFLDELEVLSAAVKTLQQLWGFSLHPPSAP